MPINLDTNLHTNVRINTPFGEEVSLKDFVKYFKKNKEFILRRSQCTMTDQFIDLVNASLYANDLGINVAEHLDIISYMIGQGFYNGRLRDVLAKVGASVEKFDGTRKSHLEEYRRGVPVFRKDPIIIDLATYCKLRDDGKITSAMNKIASIMCNDKLIKIIEDFDAKQEEINHPEYNLMAEDEWYPWESYKKPDKEQDFNNTPENDNDHFVVFEKPEFEYSGIENDNDHFVQEENTIPEEMPGPSTSHLVQNLPNGEKLIAVRKRDGNMKYLVVGKDVDVNRLPKIYSMLVREELKLGDNVTTDRLTRIMKIQELFDAGFNYSETAEYLDVPKHIIYSDSRILRNIELMSADQK